MREMRCGNALLSCIAVIATTPLSCFQHPNFTKMFDEKTGFVTREILCQPLILPADDKLVGVVEVVNKKTEEPFTTEDEEVSIKLMN